MISVGSRDGRRKGLELGYGSGAEMEETELEEGEACSYHYNDGTADDDATIDPDVVLSYLDEKLQNVLGHFQRDFEGGVSAENLGAKYGGYGSFLPAYPRSPVKCQTTSPKKGQKSSAPRSPNNLQLEDGHHNVASSNDFSKRHEHSSSHAVSLPLPRTSACDSARREPRVSSAHCAGESSLSSELGKNSVQSSHTKTLKVRIKLGSDFVQKNSDIYSGLGLDISPSSSMEGSPISSEGLSCEPHAGPDESPTSILEIMTSFPLTGNNMLSPLSDSLIYLNEKRKPHCRNKPTFPKKGVQEHSNGSVSSRVDDISLRVINPEKSEENSWSFELNSVKKNINMLKADTNSGSLACEELVANALKLPLLSNSYPHSFSSSRDTAREARNSMEDYKVKDGFLTDLSKREIAGSPSVQRNASVEKRNRNTDSAVDHHREDEKMIFQNDSLVRSKKDSNFKVNAVTVSEKQLSCEAELNNSEVGKHLDETINHLEQDIRKYSSDKEYTLEVASRNDHFSSGNRKKRKRQSCSARSADVQKYSSHYDTVSKDDEKVCSSAPLSKSKVKNSRLQKDNEKANNRYQDFFGDMDLEEGDDDADTAEMLSTDKEKNLSKIEKNTLVSTSTLNDSLEGKKVQKLLMSEPNSEVAPAVAQRSGSRLMPNAASSPLRLLVKENRVFCDLCGKLRHLPGGKNPKTLPEKWSCSMLDWLPGMNRCSISEEETTRALGDLYQVPVSRNQNNEHDYPSRVEAGLSVTEANQIDQNHHKLVSSSVPVGYKIRIGMKGGPVAITQNGPAQLSLSVNKNGEETVKDKRPDDVHQSLAGDETDLSKSDVAEKQKQRHKHKHKKKRSETHDTGGEAKSSKIKGKRSADQSCPRSSKKGKTDNAHCGSGDLGPGYGGPPTKVEPSSCTTLSGKYEEINCSKFPLSGSKDQLQVASHDGSLQMENFNDKDVAIKRKTDGTEEIRADGRDFLEQPSESLHKKEKKEKNSEKNSDSQRKAGIGSNLSHRSLDAIDTSGRDLGSVQPPQAATSSSSKVSGSRKSRGHKTCMQEMIGSPVESVSSSPLRSAFSDKCAVMRTSVKGKDDIQHPGLPSIVAPRRCLDGDHEKGNNPSGPVQVHGSLESVLDYREKELDHLPGTVGHCEPQTSGLNPSDERRNDQKFHADLSRPNKSRKEPSPPVKENNGEVKSEVENNVSRISDSCNASRSQGPCNEELSRGERNLAREKHGFDSVKVVKNYDGKEDSAGKRVSESERHRKTLFKENNVLADTVDDEDVLLNHDQRSAKKSVSEKCSLEVSGKRKSRVPASSRTSDDERVSHHMPSNPRRVEKNGGNSLLVVALTAGGASEAPEQAKRPEKLTRTHQSVKHKLPTTNGQKDSASQAATKVVKEAKDLKHRADRFKNSGSIAESTGLYFQAALKFLHGASLLESNSSRSSKQGEIAQSIQMYSSTAKLCEFCAHEFEKSKDMAAAALAYKCMEVGYMKVVYSSHAGASRERHELLQTAVQICAPGESPSSSASDVDNINNPATTTVDRVSSSKGASPSEVVVVAAGNYVIAARNRPSYARLLNFSQDVNFAMDASRKSRLAFAAAAGEGGGGGGLTSVGKALNFNFQDVQGLLHLVRQAMEAISRADEATRQEEN